MLREVAASVHFLGLSLAFIVFLTRGLYLGGLASSPDDFL